MTTKAKLKICASEGNRVLPGLSLCHGAQIAKASVYPGIHGICHKMKIILEENLDCSHCLWSHQDNVWGVGLGECNRCGGGTTTAPDCKILNNATMFYIIWCGIYSRFQWNTLGWNICKLSNVIAKPLEKENTTAFSKKKWISLTRLLA